MLRTKRRPELFAIRQGPEAEVGSPGQRLSLAQTSSRYRSRVYRRTEESLFLVPSVPKRQIVLGRAPFSE